MIDMFIDGINYNCCEQYMMAQKALLFNDKDILSFIMNSSSPKEQKSLGRKVKNFDPITWKSQCKDIVFKGNYHKFTQHEHLKQELLNTTGKILVEASPYDNIWGIGLNEESPDIHDPSKWKGKNYLGYILTKVRIQIQNDNYPIF